MELISDNASWLTPDGRRRGFLRPRRLLLAADLLSAGIAFAATAFYLWLRGIEGVQAGITLLDGGIMLLTSLALLLRSRQYAAQKRLAFWPATAALLRDIVLASAATILLSYLTKGFFTGVTEPSRLSFGIAAASFFVLGMVSRAVLSALQRRQYSSGKGVRRILVAGDGVVADELQQLIDERPQIGVAIAGRLRLDTPEWPACSNKGSSIQGSAATVSLSDDLEGLRKFDQVLRASGATEVVVALDPECQPALPKLAAFLNLAHVPFRVVPALFEETYLTSELLGRAEIPVIDLGANPLDRLGRTAKRTLDVCFSGLVLLLLLPLELAVCVAIVADSGRPVIFEQERVGKNGRRFTLYKFRTMARDAEARLKELEAQNELATSEGRMFKMRRDPRITRVGSILRKLSLDELPQFFNVLKGDMSAVGPRPPLPREVAEYESEHLYRLRVLPGVTGLWQVSGRNELSFDEMVALDRYYVDNWSLWLDLRIIFKTFAVLVSRKGAY